MSPRSCPTADSLTPRLSRHKQGPRWRSDFTTRIRALSCSVPRPMEQSTVWRRREPDRPCHPGCPSSPAWGRPSRTGSQATMIPRLVSRDGRQALILIYATGDAAAQTDTAQRLARGLPVYRGLKVQAGGAAVVNAEASSQVEHDLVTAESVALVLTLLLLVVVFRGLVAAALPLIVGGIAIACTFLGPALAHLGDQRVGIRAQSDHRPRAWAGHRLLPATGLTLPGRTRRRPHHRGRGGAHDPDGGPDGCVQRPDGGRLVAGPAAVPGVLS